MDIELPATYAYCLWWKNLMLMWGRINYTAPIPHLIQLVSCRGQGLFGVFAKLQDGIFCLPVDEGLCSCSNAGFGVSWGFRDDVVWPCYLCKYQMWHSQDKDLLAVGWIGPHQRPGTSPSVPAESLILVFFSFWCNGLKTYSLISDAL